MHSAVAEQLAAIIEQLLLALEEQFGGGRHTNWVAAPALKLVRKTLLGLSARFAAFVANLSKPQPTPLPTKTRALQPPRPAATQGWRQRLFGWFSRPSPQHTPAHEAPRTRAHRPASTAASPQPRPRAQPSPPTQTPPPIQAPDPVPSTDRQPESPTPLAEPPVDSPCAPSRTVTAPHAPFRRRPKIDVFPRPFRMPISLRFSNNKARQPFFEKALDHE